MAKTQKSVAVALSVGVAGSSDSKIFRTNDHTLYKSFDYLHKKAKEENAMDATISGVVINVDMHLHTVFVRRNRIICFHPPTMSCK
jgi:hypothetical protein